jgi:hypothetical protein
MTELSYGVAGQFCGRNLCPTLILEAVATYDLWIWYTSFDMPDTNNDIDILQRSPIFVPLRNRTMPPVLLVRRTSNQTLRSWETVSGTKQWFGSANVVLSL